jgi:hypothetical protein
MTPLSLTLLDIIMLIMTFDKASDLVKHLNQKRLDYLDIRDEQELRFLLAENKKQLEKVEEDIGEISDKE